jgi:hypothetical protein
VTLGARYSSGEYPTAPKTIEDFDGAICAKCGRTVSENDIKEQALAIAEKIAKDAFRKAGLI